MQELSTAAVASPAVTPCEAGAPSQARFVPGTVLAGRYRIVAQVGRGGMGEVYRADDLRLGQTVALKFLPALRGRNPEDLAQLHREVRIARQISHPNVCRVFDIGDSDGVPFITMEFIDGEDLASLMKRIGRLQPGKAIQLAQQLCAGLAEAHSFGVLHRDLKPANVMLDGRGNARITDFGLAIMADEVRGEDAWAGTPAYMSPEQLSGAKPTLQSDLYALGLVLYELFTGEQAFPGSTVREILERRQKGTPAKVSGIVKGLDSSIDRVILQCLEEDPRLRPKTVLQIAAALPGRDPLGAMIAAGETPSPEMIAAATDRPLIAVSRLWLMCGVIIAGIIAVTSIVREEALLGLAPLEKSPQVMTYLARQLLSDLGYHAPPADSAGWYEVDRDYMQDRAARAHVSGHIRQFWFAAPGPWRFIYRQSPRPLATLNPIVPVSRTDPPDNVPGMITVVLDANGRPLYFSAVPLKIPNTRATATPDWDWGPLLSNAGLKELVPAAPEIMPPGPFDSVSAWNARLGDENAHVIAAVEWGRPTYFEVIHPFSDITRVTSASVQERTTWLVPVLFLCIPAACFLLARRNMRLGRADREGATRLAAFVFACVVLRRSLMTHYVSNATQVTVALMYGVGYALFLAVVVAYLCYLGLEPYIRRQWPRMLISWSRALSGRFSDARVGADVLGGCAAGMILTIVPRIPRVVATWLNLPELAPMFPYPKLGQIESSATTALRGADGILSNAIYPLVNGVGIALILAAVLLIARLLLRRDWMAVLVLGLISSMLVYPQIAQYGISTSVAVGCATLIATIWIFVMFRLGILGLAVGLFTSSLINSCFTTLDFSRWYIWSSVVALAILTGLVVLGFRAALAGRPLFGRAILED